MNFPTIERGVATLKDFKVQHVKAATKADRLPKTLTLKDREFRASQRFYGSLLSRFALSDSIFQYYSPEEVFARVSSVRGDDPIRYTVEKNPDGDVLLAVTAPTANAIELPQIEQLFAGHKAIETSYYDGIVQAKFLPAGKDERDMIGDDEFQKRFALEVPIDGWGDPSTYTEMLRLICENGMVGRAAAFRQTINPGKDPMATLDRTLSTFSSAGFQAFRERLERAQFSPASVREAQWLRSLMVKHPVGAHLLTTGRYDKLVGDFTSMYGLTNTSRVSTKRQSLLDAKCRVYDLINFVTELSSHHSYDFREQRAYMSFLGQLLCNDYDMEGATDKKVKFPKFVIPQVAKLKDEQPAIDRLALTLRG